MKVLIHKCLLPGGSNLDTPEVERNIVYLRDTSIWRIFLFSILLQKGNKNQIYRRKLL